MTCRITSYTNVWDYGFDIPIFLPLQTKEKMKANNQLYALLAFEDALAKCPLFYIGATMCKLDEVLDTAYLNGLRVGRFLHQHFFFVIGDSKNIVTHWRKTQ